MPTITSLHAMEILDSRGRPTVKTTCTLDTGHSASASIPSGRSTGSSEALELRDGEANRYDGLGCRKAVANVNETIARELLGHGGKISRGENAKSQAAPTPTLPRSTRGGDVSDAQVGLDAALIQLDGTRNKSRLGANAILSVSLSFARAMAAQRGIPLYQQFAEITGLSSTPHLPRLTVNLFSGGKHAGQQIAIQDVLIVPLSARTIDESLAMTYAVYYAAADLLSRKYNQRLLRADEGGLSPPARSTTEMLDDAITSIQNAGLAPGKDIALAIDVASTHFYHDDIYEIDGQRLAAQQMIDLLASWTQRYPILSYEDGMAEEDWTHWPELMIKLSKDQITVMGDDFLCTTPERIRRAIKEQAANALLLKVNQIGTLTEAAESLRLARSAGWQVTVSARSGETEDDWLADLAVGFAADYIKIGSITQSERLAKYNRLLAIEAESHLPLTKIRHQY